MEISFLLQDPDPNESSASSPSRKQHTSNNTSEKRSMAAHAAEPPAKKQSKWSAEEDAMIIDLRGGGMKWEDISKRLPGRSALSCRLHYQNYLEKISEWDEEKKNRIARLYERFKPEMWSKVANEMGVPWRAAEAMHWELGKEGMARRARVDAPPASHQSSPSREHSHNQSQPSAMSNLAHDLADQQLPTALLAARKEVEEAQRG